MNPQGHFADVLAVAADEFVGSIASEFRAWADKGYCKRCLGDYARERHVVLSTAIVDFQNALHRRMDKVESELRRLQQFLNQTSAARDFLDEAMVDRTEPEAEGGQSYVYAVSNGTHVKIGLAVDPISRLAALQTASPLPLVILGTIPGTSVTEAEMHARFRDRHSAVSGSWHVMKSRDTSGQACCRRIVV